MFFSHVPFIRLLIYSLLLMGDLMVHELKGEELTDTRLMTGILDLGKRV